MMKSLVAAFATTCLLALAAADVSHLHNMYLPPAAVGGGVVVTTIEKHELQELPEQIEDEQIFNAPILTKQIDVIMPPMPAEEMLPPPPPPPAAPAPSSTPTTSTTSTTTTSTSPSTTAAAVEMIHDETTSMAPESEYLPPTTVAAAPQTEYLAPASTTIENIAKDYVALETTPAEPEMTVSPTEEIPLPAVMMLAPPQPNYQQYQEELMLKKAQALEEQQQQQTEVPTSETMEMVMSHELEMPVVPSDVETLAEEEPKPAHELKADGYHYQSGQQQLVY